MGDEFVDVRIRDPEANRSVSNDKARQQRIVSMELNGDKEGMSEALISSDSEPSWKRYCWRWGGLTSHNPITRRKAQWAWGICCVITGVFILLIFLVNTSLSIVLCFDSSPLYR